MTSSSDTTPGSAAAVLFDLASLCTVGEVLTSTYTEVARRVGVRWNRERADELRDRSMAGAAQLLCARAELPPDRWPAMEKGLLGVFAGLVGQHHVQRQPGVDVLLKQLWDAGVPIGVVSSTLPPETVALCLESTRLKGAVRTVQCGDRGVPPQASPALHRAALKELEADAALSVAIEHTFLGLTSAKDADLFAVTDPTVIHATGGDGRIKAYNDPDLLTRLLADAGAPRLF